MDKTDDASQVRATVKQKSGQKQNLPSIEKFCDICIWEKGDQLALWAGAKETVEKVKLLKPKQTNDQQKRDAQLDATLAVRHAVNTAELVEF